MRRIAPTRAALVPKGASKVADKQSDAEAYLYTSPKGEPAALMFFGKSDKPVFWLRFRDAGRREAAVKEYFERRRAYEKRKAEETAKRKAFKHPYKVGDLFRRSWGYDQTNVDYYEVVAVVGKMLDVREIGRASKETGYMTGQCTPQPGAYVGEIKRCLAQDGAIKINHYAHAWYVAPTVVAGVPTYGTDRWSSYA